MTDSAPPTQGATLDPAERRAAVRERYGDLAESAGGSCCGDDADCGAADSDGSRGYSGADLSAVDAADLRLGCGNPAAIAALEPGEDVLDLGSGGGFDCFLAAREVGPEGDVVGVDMTPEMVERARRNAADGDLDNVAFRLGEIEHLPVADASVDVVVSNCVLNLSPDKPRALREVYRVLRPGGRLAVSDVVRTTALPPDVRGDPASVAACVAGAATIPDLEAMLAEAGFEAVSVDPDTDGADVVREWDAERDLEEYVVAATIDAEKPATPDR